MVDSITACSSFVVAPAIPTIMSMFLLSLLLYVKLYMDESKKLVYNKLCVAKIIVSITCFILSLGEYISSHGFLSTTNPEFYTYSIHDLIFSALTTIAYYICIRNGIVSSLLLHLCWTAKFFSMVPGYMFWSKIIFNDDGKNREIFGFVQFRLIFALSFVQMVLLSFADRTRSREDEKTENFIVVDGKQKTIDPELESSALCRLFYSYAGNILTKGYEGRLEPSDFFGLDTHNKTDYLVHKFEKTIREQPREHENTKTKRKEWVPWIFWPLIKIARPKLSKSLLLSFIYTPLTVITPIFLGLLVSAVTNGSPFWYGTFVTMVMCTLSAFAWILLERMEFYGFQAFSNIKAVLADQIHKKILRLSIASREKFDTGTTLNLITNDIQCLCQVTWRAHGFITFPLTLILCFIQLYIFMGHSAWPGLIVMIGILFFNMAIQKLLHKYENQLRKHRDSRLKKSTELLKNMKILKFLGWENPFEHQISKIRAEELKSIRAANNINFGIVESSFFISAILPAIATLVSYTSIEGKELDPQTAFSTLMLFVYMKFALLLIPETINRAMKGFISLRRISEFLDADELSVYVVKDRSDKNNVIVIENARFELDHDKAEEKTKNKKLKTRNEIELEDKVENQKHKVKQVLELLNLTVPKGALVGIVGPVGSGKSGLLSVLKNEWPKTDGKVYFNADNVADVSQNHWIQNDTFRNNVCFRREYDEDLLNQVFNHCCLKEDLENNFIRGDLTEIGERGMNLSGGQRARVSLARAVYQDAEVYLLDDILSAVDNHVGQHIFQNVIGPNGLLSGKTRIFSLNSLQYLTEFDMVIVMESFTKHEIHESSGHDYHSQEHDNLCQDPQTSAVKVCRIREVRSKKDGADAFLEWVKRYTLETQERRNVEAATQNRDESERSERSEKSTEEGPDALVQEESMKEETASWHVYMTYFKHFGFGLFGVYLFIQYVIMATSEAFSNIWLAWWSSNELSKDITIGDKLLVYFLLNIVGCICNVICGLIFAYGGARASRIIHEKFINSLLHSPMRFFDTTPLGRIVNRLTMDTSLIDTDLVYLIVFFGILVRYVFQLKITILVFAPYLIVLDIGLVVLFGLLIRYFTRTSVQTRRLLTHSMSKFSSYVEDSYAGASSIRTYKIVEYCEKKMKEVIDRVIEIELTENVVSRWVNVRLSVITQLVVFGFVTAGMYMADYNLISLGILALIITNGATFAIKLSYVAKISREIEMSIVSVERMNEYIENQHEKVWENDFLKVNKYEKWPTNGTIQFDKYSLSYKGNEEFVLKDLTHRIEGGKKVGVVGRTGAGKSSIMNAVSRINEPSRGRILIDNVDIFQIGLHDLRKALNIIPQDPLLFSGPLRLNLDPKNEYGDDEIWEALRLACLENTIADSNDKLQFKIEEDGKNLSMGERQLVCWARAFLRHKKAKIIILDEATASIDKETDTKIQENIRKTFRDCTILAIAHRVETIIDYDMILVMDNGEIREYDTPKNLLENPKSLFSELYNSRFGHKQN